MKLIKLTSIVIVAFVASMFATETTAQVRNRLPRKAIIGAMQNALQDTTGASLKPFVCKPRTSSITIQVNCESRPEERPYLITADSLGVTLEIFRGEEHVFNEFFRYRGSNFTKILAKANSAKLKKVKNHGESIDGGLTTVLSFNNAKSAYFSLSDNAGIMNYEGDFDGVITEITRQIPNFQAIICKDYNKPIELKDGEIKLNAKDIELVPLAEVGTVLSVGDEKVLPIFSCPDSTFTSDLIWKETDKRVIKLIPAKQYKPKKGKKVFWGVSYEDIVKNGIVPASTTTSYGIVKTKYSFTPENKKVYILYDSNSNTAYPFIIYIEEEEAVG